VAVRVKHPDYEQQNRWRQPLCRETHSPQLYASAELRMY
jgi:hypothetical protein